MSDQSPHSVRLLLVEDDASLRRMLKINLEQEGWHVTEAADGPTALNAFRSQRLDAAILDVMLPELDGLSICRTVRLEGNKTPILFLTAKNAGEDRVEGLRLGGDDYLGKPFNLEELLLRVKKLIRMSQQGPAAEELTELSFGTKCHVDFAAYRITKHDGKEQGISKRESMLLKLLASKTGEVVSREEILEVVWGYDVFPSTRTIDNYILAFRKYFEADPKKPRHFFSVRGVGYRFEA